MNMTVRARENPKQIRKHILTGVTHGPPISFTEIRFFLTFFAVKGSEILLRKIILSEFKSLLYIFTGYKSSTQRQCACGQRLSSG